MRGACGAGECGAGRFRAHTAHRNASDDQFMDRREYRWKIGRIESGQRTFDFIEMAEQKLTPRFEIARMSRVDAIAMRFERDTCSIECFGRPAEIARHESDLGFGDDAARTRHALFRTERTRRAAQQCLRAIEVAELRHGDAAQRQRRRIVAQRHVLQRAQRVAVCERVRGGVDQRVHRNPVTLVTPTLRDAAPNLAHTPTQRTAS